jgi:hypothetical protein
VTNNWGGPRPRAGARKGNYNSLSAGTRSKRFAPFYKMLGQPYAAEFKAIVQKVIDDAMSVAPEGNSPYARRMRQLCRLHALQRLTIGMRQVREDNAADRQPGARPVGHHERAERFLDAFRYLQYTGFDSAPDLPPPEAGRDIPWHLYKQQLAAEIDAQLHGRDIPDRDPIALAVTSRTVKPVSQRTRDKFWAQIRPPEPPTDTVAPHRGRVGGRNTEVAAAAPLSPPSAAPPSTDELTG